MKSKWSKSWEKSVQPRKQRKHRANAPLHRKHKMLSAHLSDSLRKKYGVRSLPVRSGDKVKVMRGSRKGMKAEVAEVDTSDLRIYLEGQTRESAAGQKSFIPFKPSNLMITSIKSDKVREDMLSRKTGKKIKLEKEPKEDKKEKKENEEEEKPKSGSEKSDKESKKKKSKEGEK